MKRHTLTSAHELRVRLWLLVVSVAYIKAIVHRSSLAQRTRPLPPAGPFVISSALPRALIVFWLVVGASSQIISAFENELDKPNGHELLQLSCILFSLVEFAWNFSTTRDFSIQKFTYSFPLRRHEDDSDTLSIIFSPKSRPS